MLEFSSGDSPGFRDKGLQGKRMCRNVHNSGAKPGVFEPKKGGLRTAIEVCPVRVYPKRGAETPQSRSRGAFSFSPARHTHSPPAFTPRTLSPPNRTPPPRTPNSTFSPFIAPDSSFFVGVNALFAPFSSLLALLRSSHRPPTLPPQAPSRLLINPSFS